MGPTGRTSTGKDRNLFCLLRNTIFANNVWSVTTLLLLECLNTIRYSWPPLYMAWLSVNQRGWFCIHHCHRLIYSETFIVPYLHTRLTLMLCFHRSRQSTAGRIRHRGLILVDWCTRITSGSAVSCRFWLATALKTSSQVTAGRPRWSYN